MTADEFVARLEKSKRTGRGTWVACCPAHDDKHPSMTVRELPDGRILIHCFVGCDIDQITSAIGVDISDLFPDEPIEFAHRMRRPFPASDVIEALAFEIEVLKISAGDLSEGRALSDDDMARMRLAMERFENARRLALGR